MATNTITPMWNVQTDLRPRIQSIRWRKRKERKSHNNDWSIVRGRIEVPRQQHLPEGQPWAALFKVIMFGFKFITHRVKGWRRTSLSDSVKFAPSHQAKIVTPNLMHYLHVQKISKSANLLKVSAPKAKQLTQSKKHFKLITHPGKPRQDTVKYRLAIIMVISH